MENGAGSDRVCIDCKSGIESMWVHITSRNVKSKHITSQHDTTQTLLMMTLTSDSIFVSIKCQS